MRPRAFVIAIVLIGCARAAFGDPVFLLGAHYGGPARFAGTAGVLIPIGAQPKADVQPSIMKRGLIVDAAIGSGGQRVAAGWGGRMHEGTLLLTYGLDFSATLSRTTDSPRKAAARSTYAGAQAGMNLSVVRMTVGVERRVAGAAGPRGTIFTWTAGVQISLWR